MDPNIPINIAVIVLLLYSVSLHELAHAWTATWLGDPTPGKHGRLTWNPLAQLLPTPLLSIVIPVICYLNSQQFFCIAFCPVDPSHFRKPLRDRALTALAGPAMNFALVGLLVGLMWIPGLATPPRGAEMGTYLFYIFKKVALWNLILGVFNLLPFPGLDGYDIVRPALPLALRRPLDEFRQMGFLPLIVVFFVAPGLFGQVIAPFFMLFGYILPT